MEVGVSAAWTSGEPGRDEGCRFSPAGEGMTTGEERPEEEEEVEEAMPPLLL